MECHILEGISHSRSRSALGDEFVGEALASITAISL
jgi:hypothetical protein